MNHGVYVSEKGTSISTPVVAESGIPFFLGVAPVHTAAAPAEAGKPVLCTSWAEAVDKLGNSDDWDKYTLCEAMYSHFQLFGAQPAIFCNVFDPTIHKEAVAAADFTVTDKKVGLPGDALDDDGLVVKSGENTLVKGTDYATYYSNGYLGVELLDDGSAAAATELNIAYNKVKPTAVTAADVATALESIELCMTIFGIVPDLVCAPGFSHEPAVAAVMATKTTINGMFKAKALIDLDTTAVTSYDQAAAAKNAANITDAGEIVCWPMLSLGDKKFHMSVQLAGLMASVDTDNGGIPYESPSNKGFKADGLCLKDGTTVYLTLEQGNVLNGAGVVTALNFNGWKCWGNYTACYPGNTDVKDYFIPVSRMFAWANNTIIKTFWTHLDQPMNRRLIDTIMDTANIWLSGLVGSGYLLGARCEFSDEENPMSSLMAGIVKLHIFMTPPSPAQEIDFVLEYDAQYVTSALAS